jgi:thiol-disulfide isomerase/thioredoxin
MDSTTYLTNKDLKDSVNIVFINFSPNCDHCERTIKSILENIQKFPQTQFVLTSFEAFENIRKFYFDNGLNSFANIFIGQEIEYNMTKQLKYSSFPCLLLFDKNKQYIKTIDEETNAKTILKALKIK